MLTRSLWGTARAGYLSVGVSLDQERYSRMAQNALHRGTRGVRRQPIRCTFMFKKYSFWQFLKYTSFEFSNPEFSISIAIICCEAYPAQNRNHCAARTEAIAKIGPWFLFVPKSSLRAGKNFLKSLGCSSSLRLIQK